MEVELKNGQMTVYSRPDLQGSLTHNGIEIAKLSSFQRIILTTDGTLTHILEAYLLEAIQVVKLSEGFVGLTQSSASLNLNVGDEVIERKILLQGKTSKRNWIYAESVIVPDRLDERFRECLLKSHESIGRLWLEQGIETFKEIIHSNEQFAENLSEYFNISKQEKLFSRTYRVFSNRQLIMTITEKFPTSYFV